MKQYYFVASDLLKEGSWRWLSDGTSVNLSWYGGYPDNYRYHSQTVGGGTVTEDCLKLWSVMKYFNDFPCVISSAHSGDLAGFICETQTFN